MAIRSVQALDEHSSIVSDDTDEIPMSTRALEPQPPRTLKIRTPYGLKEL